MMAPVHDLRCGTCQRVEIDVIVGQRPYPECPECGGSREWIPSRLNTDIWGQSQEFESLGRTFESKSDLRAYAKQHGLIEAGDPVGGARNMDRLRGTVFSGGAMASRSKEPVAHGSAKGST